MRRELKRLAARRAALVAQCAGQRRQLADELALLPAPFSLATVRGCVTGRGALALALAGIGLGLFVARGRRLVSIATTGLSIWRTLRAALPFLTR